MQASTFGVIGLGVMGNSLSHNLVNHGFKISVYNRLAEGEAHLVPKFLDALDTKTSALGFTNLEDFVNTLERPRKILIMIKAGAAIDYVLDALLPLLSDGDIIIDGGNSFYKDTNRRITDLRKSGIHFLGCGISGGEEGALKGPSMMVGGSEVAYAEVAPILETIAAKDQSGNSCCAYVGAEGAGHFVKMIHNGIEYVEMQLLAELYALLSKNHTNEAIAELFSEWNKTDVSSYLLEITIAILKAKENGTYVLDTILDKAGNKGTGSWSTKVALELGSVNTMMSSAVFARYISSFKTTRTQLSKLIDNTEQSYSTDMKSLENAYLFARLINHHQGFELIKEAYKTYNWDLNRSQIARIWTNGCIIRSQLMETSAELFKTNDSYLKDNKIKNEILAHEPYIVTLLKEGLSHRIPLDTFYAAYNYWISITSGQLPANLIQAQRDYFGAHGYEKIGYSTNKLFHTKWKTL